MGGAPSQPLLLTIIKLLKVVTLLSWGRFSSKESPAPILRPHPPKMLDEVGVVISQVNMAFSRRKGSILLVVAE